MIIKYILAAIIGLSSFSFLPFPAGFRAVSVAQASGISVSISEAKHIVLKKVTGKVIRIGLSREAGEVVYNVDIKRSNSLFRVRVDASSGEILDVKKMTFH